jgi:hypothetical protein
MLGQAPGVSGRAGGEVGSGWCPAELGPGRRCVASWVKPPSRVVCRGGVEQENGNDRARGVVMIRAVAKLNNAGECLLQDLDGNGLGLARVLQGARRPG